MSPNLDSFNCNSCTQPDTDEMVQCDSCNHWHHYACVGVDANVANQEWNCVNCSPPAPSPQQNEAPPAIPAAAIDDDQGSSVSATSAIRKRQLLLQQLEEEKRLREESNQLYLQRKYQILSLDSDDEEFETINCKPQQQLANSTTYKPTQQHLQAACSNDVLQPPKPPKPTRHAVQTSLDDSKTISPGQLAARNAIPKDLPKFSGSPEEWPIFISSFEQSTELAAFSNGENLIRLQKCLYGRALEAVKHRLVLPAMVPDVIKTLRMLFGRPDQIIHALIERAKNITPPKSDKLESLIDYALAIKNVCATMEATNSMAHLNNPTLLKEFVDKLSPNLLLNWAIYARNLQSSASLLDFSNWLYDIAEAACSVTTLSPTTSSGGKRPSKQSGHLHAHVVANESDALGQSASNQKACYICNDSHRTSSCEVLKKACLSERWQMVRQYNLCRSCLEKHIHWRCKFSKACGIDGCQAKHHILLHKKEEQTADNCGSTASLLSYHSPKFGKVLFQILPVTLFANGKTVDTFAFLDGGSSLTLIDEELTVLLGLSGRAEELCLRWTSGATRVEDSSKVVSLEIAGRSPGSRKYQLNNVRTVQSLDLPTQSSSQQELAEQYSHLVGLPIPSYQRARPRILIGMDNWKLGVPLKVSEGTWSQPIATKTRLGWSVHGPDEGGDRCDSFHLSVCDCNADRELHQLVNKFFSIENVGVRILTQQIVSSEEKRATKILEDTCTHINGRFEVGLLWKFDDVSLPNSLPMALRRYHRLQKGIDKDAELRSNLDQQIANLVAKGYAKKLSPDELKLAHNRIWYLPIFIVRNPNKPSKVRLVWDAAAKCDGTSLNDFLLKGPDQLVPLVTVLYGFRCGKIGVCGDIAEMFHQVRVWEQDRHVQRFLWNDAKDSKQPSVFEMNVMTFGATCSPCIAHYVKNKNAMNFMSSMPRAVEGIIEHHYVDDFIDSVDTEEEAIKLAKDVRFIHKNAGFHIRNWVSNSPKVLEAMKEDNERITKAFGLNDALETEKILGLYWCTSSDAFTYVLKFNRLERDVFNQRLVPTKREVLKILMSVFDPLGFISHFLICIKILLQEIWRTSIGWNDELPASAFEKWLRWTALLQNVTTIQVPRCYSPLLCQADIKVQLHTFVDASEKAYAAVSYFRIISGPEVDVTIVCAKSKVAPQRPISVPRLELQAAVLGVRLAEFISKSHKFSISQRFFWTDSKTVLSWLSGDPRKFQQFVMFRIGEILETSHISEWRWVPTKLNTADKATKWNSELDYHATSLWFSGPTFLKASETEWPQTPQIDTSNEEVRPHVLHTTAVARCRPVDENRFSTWTCMYRSLAYALLYLDMRLKRQPFINMAGPTSECIKRSKAALYRQAQLAAYPDELNILKKHRSLKKIIKLPKNSPLAKLSPFLDDEDIIRTSGRLLFADCVGQDCKTPIILPKLHRITFLIVDSYHRKFHHCNHETVLNEIKQMYFIANLRSILKTVRRSCQLCKMKAAVPVVPEMANLPMARMRAFTRPFSYVGLDYVSPSGRYTLNLPTVYQLTPVSCA